MTAANLFSGLLWLFADRLLFFFTLADTTLLFAFGIPISGLNLPLAVICSVAVCFFLSGRSVKRTIGVFSAAMLVLVIAAVLSGLIFDWSYDGNTYHKSIAGALKWGWNPLRETFYDFAEDVPFLSELKDTWYDAYPKLTEIWAASLYIFTNNIEAGKCFNLLVLAALFCICYAVLVQTELFRKPQSALCALFCVANPVSVSQIITYYVDGCLWQVFLACMVALLYLTFFENGKYRNGCFYLIFISICLGFNIKFSALIFFAVLCICFFGYWVVGKCRKEGWKASKGWIVKRFLLFALAVITGTGVVGATSYGINIVRHANPVYTLIGEGSTDILSVQLPFQDMPYALRFVASLLSRSSGSFTIEQVEWKIPFTFNAVEFSSAQGYDTRTAGWGIVFSGIFLLSLMILWMTKVKLKGKTGAAAQAAHLAALLLGALVLCIFFVPGLSWARYNGALFYIPVGALLCLFAFSNRNGQNSTLYSFVAGILSTALLLNIMPNLDKIWQICEANRPMYDQLAELKELTETASKPVAVGVVRGEGGGRFFTLYDMGITNFEYKKIMPEDIDGTLFSYPMLGYIDPRNTDPLQIVESLHDTAGKVILLAVKDDGSNALTNDFIAGMRDLGLDFPLEGAYRSSYIAVINDGKVLAEGAAEDALAFQSQVGDIFVDIISAGYEKGNMASIKVDDTEYAVNQRGLNIVIYDIGQKSIIDSLCIDTSVDNRVVR